MPIQVNTVREFSEVCNAVALSTHELCCMHLAKYMIDASNTNRIQQHPQRVAPGERQVMHEQGVFLSSSPWSSPIVLPKKKGCSI